MKQRELGPRKRHRRIGRDLMPEPGSNCDGKIRRLDSIADSTPRQPMAQRIAAGPRLSSRRFRPRAALGVAAIGFDLSN
ncbi:hypothetical protein [Bradyrhizobium ottawaense]|uniref:hypothetical protein n=1 Tax=Bradyrhizobium ottawaense TaxID=931866 RepID=UPI003835AD9F